MSFELLVRPFQTVQISPNARVAYQSPDDELEDVIIEIGKSGQVLTLNGSTSSSTTAFTETKTKEIDRDTTERRVENPDDPSQYVMVEDTNKLRTESGKKETYKKEEIELTVQGGANVKLSH